MALNVSVADIMTRPAVSIGTDAKLFDALMTLRTYSFSGLPVIDPDGRVVGVVSERDIARVIAGSPARHDVRAFLDLLMVGLVEQPHPTLRDARQRLEETTVEEAMSAPAFVIEAEAPMELAAEVMTENTIDRLPVVEDDRLLGIVTRSDLIRAIVARPT